MAEEPPQKRTRLGEPPKGRVARIVVVGAGSWAQGWHLPHLQHNPSAEILAIVDPATLTWSKYNASMKPTRELGEHYGVPVFDTFDSFLQSELAGHADGVVISSSHASHHEIGMKAIKAGLHILVEKPMTADVQEAHELAAAAAKSKQVFMVNNSANFTEQAIRAHELVKAGEIGEVEHASCYMIREREFFEDPQNTGWVRPSGSMIGNGFAWGQASHTLAWIFMVTGLTPKTVFCQMVNSKATGADIFDSAIIRCTNGATICAQGVAGLPGTNSVGTTSTKGKLIENKIFGSKGCLMYSGDDADPASGNLELVSADGANKSFPGFYFENTSKEGIGPESLQNFLAACLGETSFNGADADIGLKVVQTIHAMYKSAKSGAVQVVE